MFLDPLIKTLARKQNEDGDKMTVILNFGSFRRIPISRAKGYLYLWFKFKLN